MNFEQHRDVERAIVRRVVEDLCAAGYALNVDNGGDMFVLPAPTTSVLEILPEMFATDDEILLVYHPESDEPYGSIRLVYGNEGWDVVSDYETHLESNLQGANAVADYYALL